MTSRTGGTKSLKEYLKRYESNEKEEKKIKKKKKAKQETVGVLVVDEDPVWQKPVNLVEEENDDSAEEERPQVNEDIEVRRMKRLEQIRARRAYNAVAEDGSGWVSLSSKPTDIDDRNPDVSPPRRPRARNDTPSPEPGLRHTDPRKDDDLSPPRQRKRHHSPLPAADDFASDLSIPRKPRARNDTPSPESEFKKPKRSDNDLSPPRQRRKQYHSPSPEHGRDRDMSPPRRTHKHTSDISPQRRGRHGSPHRDDKHALPDLDLSPPRKNKKDLGRQEVLNPSPRQSRGGSIQNANSHASLGSDLSPPRKNQKGSPALASFKETRKAGLISGRDMREEILRTKNDELKRFKEMDPSVSGRGAEPVFRDKNKGEAISKEEYLKSKQKVEEKPKEIKLEWGKGLAQKREAEARQQELESEKDKPFARTRDDPELDNLLKERVRWGDPMAHLVKKKRTEPGLLDLGDNEKMKESGFIIPQDIPSHSWIKRGLDAAPNRFGIKPGRHWDGVDRSNGFEKKMFQRKNEKEATQREAYLWSVSDM